MNWYWPSAVGEDSMLSTLATLGALGSMVALSSLIRPGSAKRDTLNIAETAKTIAFFIYTPKRVK
jgi:hypothetical protein